MWWVQLVPAAHLDDSAPARAGTASESSVSDYVPFYSLPPQAVETDGLSTKPPAKAAPASSSLLEVFTPLSVRQGLADSVRAEVAQVLKQ